MNRIAPLLLIASVCSACATVPPPVDALTATDAAIRRAEAARVSDYTPPELRNARERQAAARSAFAQGDMRAATWRTEEARLDAELALSKLDVSRLQFEVEGMKKSNEALRQVLLRDAVNVAPIPIPLPANDPALQPGQ